MAQEITWQDRQNAVDPQNPTSEEVVTASIMNEIKNKHNNNAQELDKCRGGIKKNGNFVISANESGFTYRNYTASVLEVTVPDGLPTEKHWEFFAPRQGAGFKFLFGGNVSKIGGGDIPNILVAKQGKTALLRIDTLDTTNLIALSDENAMSTETTVIRADRAVISLQSSLGYVGGNYTEVIDLASSSYVAPRMLKSFADGTDANIFYRVTSPRRSNDPVHPKQFSAKRNGVNYQGIVPGYSALAVKSIFENFYPSPMTVELSGLDENRDYTVIVVGIPDPDSANTFGNLVDIYHNGVTQSQVLDHTTSPSDLRMTFPNLRPKSGGIIEVDCSKMVGRNNALYAVIDILVQ